MTIRRFVLWLTGRDLLEPKERLQPGTYRIPQYATLRITPITLWEMTIGGQWNSITFGHAVGPNVIHRLLQRVVLGIHWRMK